MSSVKDEEQAQIRSAYSSLVAHRQLAPRWGQRQMIAEVANTLAALHEDGTEASSSIAPGVEPDSRQQRTDNIAVVEAGTGTGKTIAYALPGIVISRSRGKRLVISTATVALQEQLLHKDLPDIQAGSGLEFSFALAKGRRRYICVSQLDRLLASDPGSDSATLLYPDETASSKAPGTLDQYRAMLEALGRGDWDGDRDSWSDSIPDVDWFAVTADQSQCTGRRCSNIRNCSFFRARDGLQNAEVIVTNHDLVLADLALGGGVILPPPEDSLYIFDEGHHLPEKAVKHFASFCRLQSTRRWLGECQKAFARGAQFLSSMGLDAELESIATELDDAAQALEQVEHLARQLLDEQNSGRSETGSPVEQLRFPRGEVPSNLRELASQQQGLWSALKLRVNKFSTTVERHSEDQSLNRDSEEFEQWLRVLGAMGARIDSTLALWVDYALEQKESGLADKADEIDTSAKLGRQAVPPQARWLARRSFDQPTARSADHDALIELHSSRVLAAELLRERLWCRAAAVVLTSATMTALGRFDRFVLASGVPENCRQKIVASPFDHSRASLRIPAMASDPSDSRAHTEEVLALLPDLLDSQAGSLVLFSSRRQLNAVYEGLSKSFRDRTLCQDDFGKAELLRMHKDAVDAGKASIVFGLASFAEGIDLPGDYCRCVVIAKLSFPVPDSPIDATLAEWVEDCGRNSFMELSVPEAAQRLVQASGRLLRTETDDGRITLLDRRVLTRRYGSAIIDSLPPFKREFQRP
ncbi:MAG: ATP-dependent DNA helicase DinG [Pseudomonadota bacterium]